MSRNKTPALLEAVAGLPVSQHGLALGALNTLRDTSNFPNAHRVLKDALSLARDSSTKLPAGAASSSVMSHDSSCKVAFTSQVEAFVASTKFIVDTSEAAVVKIARVGDRFKIHFFGKYEVPSRVPIIDCETEATLLELYTLMHRQGQGQEGLLLTSGYPNYFDIRDVFGKLRPVHCYWDGEGWGLACPLIRSMPWYVKFAGGRVFFRRYLTALPTV